MASDRHYEAKEMARLDLQEAVKIYLEAADGYEMGAQETADEMGAQETADEMTDIFINLSQPYKVETE